MAKIEIITTTYKRKFVTRELIADTGTSTSGVVTLEKGVMLGVIFLRDRNNGGGINQVNLLGDLAPTIKCEKPSAENGRLTPFWGITLNEQGRGSQKIGKNQRLVVDLGLEKKQKVPTLRKPIADLPIS